MACSGHPGLVVSTRLMTLYTFSVKLNHAPPLMLETNARACFVAFELGSCIEALSLSIIPSESAIKLILDVGEHGEGVSMHHVITIEALSMGDPCPP